MVYGRLVVDIISAADLPNLDFGFRAESDPYVIVKFGSKELGRTKTLDNQPNPVWNENFYLDIDETETSAVILEVWDEDAMKRDEKIGTVTVPWESIHSTKRTDNPPQTTNIEGAKRGTLTYLVAFRKFGAEISAERKGQKKALQVGINYLTLPAGKGKLNGCINDVRVMNELLKTHYGFTDENIRILRDDDPNNMPTKANILAGMAWLTSGAKAGDSLFFQFSGHGGQVDDLDGDEEDKKDETLIPVDFQTAGQITDDVVFQRLISPLPKGVFLTAVMDCCHSGTGMDLPYIHHIKTSKVNVAEHHNEFEQKATGPKSFDISSDANAVMFSGCLDHQTSSDAKIQGEFSGAMTFSLKTALERCNYQTNYHQLLVDMHQILTDGKYAQIPQLSTARPFDLKSVFTI